MTHIFSASCIPAYASDILKLPRSSSSIYRQSLTPWTRCCSFQSKTILCLPIARLVATAVDFFPAIDHETSKSRKSNPGFFTLSQKSAKLCVGNLNFPRHKSPPSALTCMC